MPNGIDIFTSYAVYTIMIKFKSQKFFYAIAVILSLLVGVNIATLLSGNLLSLIPILFLSSVLYLIRSRNRWARVGVKVWAVFLAMGGGGRLLSLLGELLVYWANTMQSSTQANPSFFQDIDWVTLGLHTRLLIVAVVIYRLSNKYMVFESTAGAEV